MGPYLEVRRRRKRPPLVALAYRGHDVDGARSARPVNKRTTQVTTPSTTLGALSRMNGVRLMTTKSTTTTTEDAKAQVEEAFQTARAEAEAIAKAQVTQTDLLNQFLDLKAEAQVASTMLLRLADGMRGRLYSVAKKDHDDGTVKKGDKVDRFAAKISTLFSAVQRINEMWSCTPIEKRDGGVKPIGDALAIFKAHSADRARAEKSAQEAKDSIMAGLQAVADAKALHDLSDADVESVKASMGLVDLVL